MNRLARHLFHAAQGSVGLLGLLLFWHLAAVRLGNDVLLPSPHETFGALVELLGSRTFYKDILASLRRVLAGYACAVVLGVPLALAMASWKPLNRALLPLVTLLRPIPPIAWIPLAILWFGLGDPPSFFITALAAFFPIFLNSLDGGLAARREHLEAARTLGARPMALALEVRLPSALPMIATGLRVGLGQSFMAVVTAELIAAQNGLGYLIQASRLSLHTSHVLVGMFAIGVLGAVMTAGFGALERRYLVPWKEK